MLESSAVPPLCTSVLSLKNVTLLFESCLLRLNWSCITKAHSVTACPAVSCSSTCMWQGTGMYAPLVPVLLSLNLSFCLFFTSLLHQSLFFPSHLDKVLLQIFPKPFLVPWTYVDTFHCLWFWTPWGICKWPTCSASTLSWTCSTHSSLPQLTPQSWLRYNLSAGVVTLFSPLVLPKRWGVISCRSCLLRYLHLLNMVCWPCALSCHCNILLLFALTSHLKCYVRGQALHLHSECDKDIWHLAAAVVLVCISMDS